MNAILINLIIFIIQEAIKYGPDAVAAIKEFIDKLSQTEFTTEQLEALKITDEGPFLP
jgi:hypothetical protein